MGHVQYQTVSLPEDNAPGMPQVGWSFGTLVVWNSMAFNTMTAGSTCRRLLTQSDEATRRLVFIGNSYELPKNYGKSQFFLMGKLTVSMAMFNSKLLNYQRVIKHQDHHQYTVYSIIIINKMVGEFPNLGIIGYWLMSNSTIIKILM